MKKKINKKIRTPLLNWLKHPNKDAIWVFGFQKSGTSAIAGLLAYMSDKTVIIDTPYLWPPYNTAIKEGTLTIEEQCKRYSLPFSRDILKDPGTTFYIDKIESYFRLKKYVFIIRNPIDNVKSILDRLGLPGNKEEINMGYVHLDWRHKFSSGGKDYIKDLCLL